MFLTSPEISPIFARCLAMQARQAMDRSVPEILELGPGTGVLAADLFAELKAQGAAPRKYRLLEVSADLRERRRPRECLDPHAYARARAAEGDDRRQNDRLERERADDQRDFVARSTGVGGEFNDGNVTR